MQVIASCERTLLSQKVHAKATCVQVSHFIYVPHSEIALLWCIEQMGTLFSFTVRIFNSYHYNP